MTRLDVRPLLTECYTWLCFRERSHCAVFIPTAFGEIVERCHSGLHGPASRCRTSSPLPRMLLWPTFPTVFATR